MKANDVNDPSINVNQEPRSRKSWDEDRLAAFLAGPVTWAPLVIFVVIVVAVTIGYLDIGITVGTETAGVVLADPEVDDELGRTDAGVDGELAAGGSGSVSGSVVFGSNCAACHGASGEGGVGPGLAGRSISPGVISSVVESGRGAMPSFGSRLSDEEIAAVVDYVAGLGGEDATGDSAAGATTSVAGGGGGSVSGSAVFGSNCAGCHGASGEGGVGPALAGRSISRAAVRSVVGSGRGAMPSFGSRLSEEEVAAVAAYVAGLGGGGSSSGSAAGATTTMAGAAGGGGSVSGSVVFGSNCAGCHGASGEGGVGPGLAGRSISRAAVRSVVGSGRGAMPSFGSRLSDEEIAAVAAYVAGLGGGGSSGGAGTGGSTGGSAAGATTTVAGGAAGGGGGSVSGSVVFGSNCAGCHGASGEGGVGPGLAGRSISPGVIRSMVESGRGAMPSFGSRLSDEEIAAVVDYVAGLGAGTVTEPAPPPTQPSGTGGAFGLYCSSCHGADGRGTDLGRDLRGRDADDVIEAVRFGEDEMPAFPETVISDAQLVEIVTYVKSIKERD